jgi:hypothetical protein
MGEGPATRNKDPVLTENLMTKNVAEYIRDVFDNKGNVKYI